jgi:hypothetical protein
MNVMDWGLVETLLEYLERYGLTIKFLH